MPLDFTPTSIVKSAKRTFTTPITSANTFGATAYGADTAANRNTAKDSWNVRLKIHEPHR